MDAPGVSEFAPSGAYSEELVGESPAFFPSFVSVAAVPGVRHFLRKPVSPGTLKDFILIDKVVCVKCDSLIMNVSDTRRLFRVLEFRDGEMQLSVCQSCYAKDACSTGQASKARFVEAVSQ